MRYTVKELADLAGVSRRTLHYYDEIELLKPSAYGENGYRFYGEEALVRLQQILFFRELDFSLKDIRAALDQPGLDLLSILQDHKRALEQQVYRLLGLIDTVDQTLLHLKGEIEMNPKQFFEAFDEEQQKKYEQEALQRWDPELVKSSIRRWKNYSKEEKDRILREGGEIYGDILANMAEGAHSDVVQKAIARWHQHLRYFYEPTFEILRGLGQGYASDPAFASRFAEMHPDLPEFLRDAISHYCDSL